MFRSPLTFEQQVELGRNRHRPLLDHVQPALKIDESREHEQEYDAQHFHRR